MATRAGFFVLVLLLTAQVASEYPPRLIVWNVGQGQWVTLVDEVGCWHFDTGGEFAPWESLMKECRARRNFLSLSHWDWDHVGLASKARYYLPEICLVVAPQGSANERKTRLIRGMAECPAARAFNIWSGTMAKNANASSHVVYWRGALLPGDSSRDQEKIWVRALGGVERTRYLVLGHHGSATSTGVDLLKKLRQTRVAIASARSKRYGHPHPRVIRDLREKRIPLLRTEDWGSITIWL